MPWTLSPSSISRYVLNHEDLNYFQPSKVSRFKEEMKAK